MKQNAGVVICYLLVAACVAVGIYGFWHWGKGLTEANEERQFEARVVNVQIVQREKLDCPQVYASAPAMTVVRIEFDREIKVWSENGTGNGEDGQTKHIDLLTDSQIDERTLSQWRSLLGKDAETFVYSASALSPCDKERIPVIWMSRFKVCSAVSAVPCPLALH